MSFPSYVDVILKGLMVGLGFGASVWFIKYTRRLLTGVLVLSE